MPLDHSRLRLDREVLDLARHRRTDPSWMSDAWSRGLAFPVYGAELALETVEPPRLWLRRTEDLADPGERFFLGVDGGGTPYFAVASSEPPRSPHRAPLREVGHRLSPRQLALARTAVAVAYWALRHRWCPTTGKPSTLISAGWRRTTQARPPLRPHISPAVVALVHDDVPGPSGQCLLVRGVGKPRGHFGCVSGYVEPGESAEAAVCREVREEVGADVAQPRYLASQPWPYPDQLMLGFSVVADPGQPLRTDPGEIAEAMWFRRDELAASPVTLPAPGAIAAELISDWLAADSQPTPAVR